MFEHLKKYNFLNAWTDRDGVIYLQFLENNKKITRKILSFKPYFYLKLEDFLRSKKLFAETFQKLRLEEKIGKDWVKISYNYRAKWEIQKFFNDTDIQTFELDLRPHQLLFLDYNLKIEKENYKILFFDIETEDLSGGIEIGQHQILSIGLMDNVGNKYFLCEEDERLLLRKFLEITKKYDVLVGWYSSRFDFPFIKERCKLLHIYFDWNFIMHVDFIKLVEKIYNIQILMSRLKLRGFSLGDVGEAFLNIKKLETGGEGYGGRIWNMFKNDRKKLEEYNIRDVEILKKLDDKLNLTKILIELCSFGNIPLDVGVGIGNVIDMIFLKEGRKIGLHFKTYEERPKERYPGALILEPEPNLYKNICLFDFVSMYPNIVRTFNISPETFMKEPSPNDIITPNNIHFSRKKGFLPKLIDGFIKRRITYKNLKLSAKEEEKIALEVKETAMKLIANSSYGIFGSPFNRYCNVSIASAITLTGQFLLKKIKEVLDEKEYKVIYGDTDGIYVEVKDLKDVFEKHILKELIKKGIEGVITDFKLDESYLEMKLEKVFSKFMILSKKRYSGYTIWDDKKGFLEDKDKYIYSKGIELVRRDFTELGKEFLDKIVEILLIKDLSLKDSKKECIKVVANYKKNLLKNKIDYTKIIITQKISKMPKEYKSLPLHTQIAIEGQKKGERYFVSMGVPYIIISSRPKLKGILAKNFAGKYDTRYYWTNKIFPAIERILEVVFPEERWEFYRRPELGVQQTLNQVKKIRNEFESFICVNCKKTYRRPPLLGQCDCGGKLGFFSEGDIFERLETD